MFNFIMDHIVDIFMTVFLIKIIFSILFDDMNFSFLKRKDDALDVEEMVLSHCIGKECLLYVSQPIAGFQTDQIGCKVIDVDDKWIYVSYKDVEKVRKKFIRLNMIEAIERIKK